MSRLFGLGRQASEYIRRRMGRATRQADEVVSRSSDERSRRGFVKSLADYIFGQRNRRQPPPPPGRPIPPPIDPDASGGRTPPRPPGPPPTGFPDGLPDDDDQDDDRELGYGDIELLGRDASYDPADWQAVMEGMQTTPGSSNVYGFYFEREARRTGILYVTFIASYRTERRTGAGPTYAYYDVPVAKAIQFRQATDGSAGNAVWDYLRIRGTVSGHQHQYRLVQVAGDYVPRKATPLGYRTRHLPVPGTGRRQYQRSTLPEQLFARPDRGRPDRGEPDRG